MATIYVSYRSSEEPFVRAVVDRLEARHDVRIDYHIPAGADSRSHQLDEMRACDVFLVFVSNDTRQSDVQNAEMGSARFCQAFIDGKTIIPALLDDVEPPRPLANLDCLDLTGRDPAAAAEKIEKEIAARAPRIRLFISHAHLDRDIAARLVDVITSNLRVPDGEIRCTSVEGYQLDLGAMAPDVLRRELGSAACVITVLTPNSLANDWVLFELGAAWANAKTAIPLLAGGPESKDIPGPLRGAAGGQLSSPGTIDRLLDQLQRLLGWARQDNLVARNKGHELVAFIAGKVFSQDDTERDLKASFTAKRATIGARQGGLLDHITAQSRRQEYLRVEDFPGFSADNELYYRLEQLRLLGFLTRRKVGESNDVPIFGWALSDKYRREIGR